MPDYYLQMGCLSSRSPSVSPIESSSSSSKQTTNNNKINGVTKSQNPQSRANGQQASKTRNYMDTGQLKPKDNYSDSGTAISVEDSKKQFVNIGTSLDRVDSGDDIMSILMNERGDAQNVAQTNASRDRSNNNIKEDSNNMQENGTGFTETRQRTFDNDSEMRQKGSQNRVEDQLEREGDENQETGGDYSNNNGVVALPDQNNGVGTNDGSQENSFDEELNVDLLRQYIAVDFEISQLEDRDALRLYHEKIEQLEQLERELDMISFEAEEMASRSETDMLQLDRFNSPNVLNRTDLESNSIMSGATGSMSAHSSIMHKNQQMNNNRTAKGQSKGRQQRQQDQEEKSSRDEQQQRQQQIQTRQRNEDKHRFSKDNNLSYSTIEDVFNRKIILEKERDKLKKEVEMIIIECDRLQQRYKKRDDILDKLFDGRTGNGLENHLEQQLVWLMEQKHYVDQVFYAWKRAETLTSQTCEQFANALELLKRMPKVQDDEQRQEIAKSICNLLIKSRQDMEQAQRYNPNVDAPFFTDAETERFDRIIGTIQSQSISPGDYNQMATVVQFAYKRAVSIRLWLEQILQITIARDSFELAEEYKWIAIQLRKERISLINSKLQDEPYRAMAEQIRDQLTRQQLQQQQEFQQRQLQHNQISSQLAITDGKLVDGQNGRNRDSGVESDDIDIEEDIYRLLEMNKSRLEAAVAASKEAGLPQATALDATGRPIRSQPVMPAKGQNHNRLSSGGELSGSPLAVSPLGGTSAASSSQRDQMMRERIERRVNGEQRLASSVVPMASVLSAGEQEQKPRKEEANGSIGKPSQQQRQTKRSSDPMKRDSSQTRNSLRDTHQKQQVPATEHNTDEDNQSELTSAASSATMSKFQIQLDEESRQNVLKQVHQMHTKHRSRLEDLRGSNKAKASGFLANKMQPKAEPPNEAKADSGIATAFVAD